MYRTVGPIYFLSAISSVAIFFPVDKDFHAGQERLWNCRIVVQTSDRMNQTANMTRDCVQYLISEMAHAKCIKAVDNEVVLENYNRSESGSKCLEGLQNVKTSQIRCGYEDIKEILSRKGVVCDEPKANKNATMEPLAESADAQSDGTTEGSNPSFKGAPNEGNSGGKAVFIAVIFVSMGLFLIAAAIAASAALRLYYTARCPTVFHTVIRSNHLNDQYPEENSTQSSCSFECADQRMSTHLGSKRILNLRCATDPFRSSVSAVMRSPTPTFSDEMLCSLGSDVEP